jgi:hypothetical protein
LAERVRLGLRAADHVHHLECDFGIGTPLASKPSDTLTTRPATMSCEWIEQVDDAHLLDAGGIARCTDDRKAQDRDERASKSANWSEVHLNEALLSTETKEPGKQPGTNDARNPNSRHFLQPQRGPIWTVHARRYATASMIVAITYAYQ